MKHGLLVSMAVADSYGAGFEFRPREFVDKHNTLEKYYPHQLSKGDHKPGMYTDDTQMSLALAEFMLSGQPLTTLNLADAFVEAFKRDPRTGYSGGFYKLLMEIKDGTELLRRLRPHSAKCGGAMRAPVLGLLPDERLVIDRAAWQASLTHATPTAMVAASGAAFLTHLCRRGFDLTQHDNLVKYMDSKCGAHDFSSFGCAVQNPVTTDAMNVMHAVVMPFNTRRGDKRTMSGLLRTFVGWSGDVDTVAAIGMAAASQHPDIEQDIPDHLIEGLENGPYGRDYLAKIDAQLEAAFPLESDVAPEEDSEPPEGDDPDDDGLDEDILSFFNDTTEEPDDQSS